MTADSIKRTTYFKLTEAVYRRWCPEKLDKVGQLMDKYKNQEDEVYHKALEMYVFNKRPKVWQPLIEAMYRRFNPAKLETLKDILKKYEGDEAGLFKALCNKYVKTLREEDPPLELCDWTAAESEDEDGSAKSAVDSSSASPCSSRGSNGRVASPSADSSSAEEPTAPAASAAGTEATPESAPAHGRPDAASAEPSSAFVKTPETSARPLDWQGTQSGGNMSRWRARTTDENGRKEGFENSEAHQRSTKRVVSLRTSDHAASGRQTSRQQRERQQWTARSPRNSGQGQNDRLRRCSSGDVAQTPGRANSRSDMQEQLSGQRWEGRRASRQHTERSSSPAEWRNGGTSRHWRGEHKTAAILRPACEGVRRDGAAWASSPSPPTREEREQASRRQAVVLVARSRTRTTEAEDRARTTRNTAKQQHRQQQQQQRSWSRSRQLPVPTHQRGARAGVTEAGSSACRQESDTHNRGRGPRKDDPQYCEAAASAAAAAAAELVAITEAGGVLYKKAQAREQGITGSRRHKKVLNGSSVGRTRPRATGDQRRPAEEDDEKAERLPAAGAEVRIRRKRPPSLKRASPERGLTALASASWPAGDEQRQTSPRKAPRTRTRTPSARRRWHPPRSPSAASAPRAVASSSAGSHSKLLLADTGAVALSSAAASALPTREASSEEEVPQSCSSAAQRPLAPSGPVAQRRRPTLPTPPPPPPPAAQSSSGSGGRAVPSNEIGGGVTAAAPADAALSSSGSSAYTGNRSTAITGGGAASSSSVAASPPAEKTDNRCVAASVGDELVGFEALQAFVTAAPQVDKTQKRRPKSLKARVEYNGQQVEFELSNKSTLGEVAVMFSRWLSVQCGMAPAMTAAPVNIGAPPGDLAPTAAAAAS
eukprot:CAMPEP_0172935468 /NCGR_PEP_ID=MMETSP1075-20121228/221526_1 /TAXON_ID=2916 /ORGANISM="Ceratium fusus, Strain PA161109" /LENGTH=880 /DNA_ID=CAMNT_0013796827 /DNA_START=68 /DNA_END=2711 /DNA_ORIENTATION=+